MWTRLTDEVVLQRLIELHSNDYVGVDKGALLDEHLRAFTIDMYKQLTRTENVPGFVASMSKEVMARYAYHLCLFSSALTDIQKSMSLYKSHYDEFLQLNNFYTRGLSDANPCILRAHVTQLYSRASKMLDSDPVPESALLALADQLRGAQLYVQHMNDDLFGGMKYLLDGYLKMTLAQIMDKMPAPSASERERVVGELLDSAKASFEKIHTCRDRSVDYYGNADLKPGLPFKTVAEAIDYVQASSPATTAKLS